MSSKEAFRREAKSRRAELARAHPDFAREAAAHVAALDIPDGSVVGAYVAARDEADPRLILQKLAACHCTIAFPRVAAKDGPLVFHRLNRGDAMAPGAFAIPEPPGDRPLAYPKILLVPLLAFDRAGHRLGYGGGYYDRTLDFLRANAAVRAIGVAYAGQEVDALPREAHDQPLDAVITEAGVRKFTGRKE